ncbi:universal stress protein [Chloroflexota bacterium]
MYQNIMVPLDGSELAEFVLPHVAAIAGGCHVAKVSLIRAVAPIQLYGGLESRFNPEEREHIDKDSMNVARDYIEQVGRQLKEKGLYVEFEVLYGNVIDTLVDYANNHDVDLIVMTTHGRSGVSRWFLGSVADRLLRSAAVPVMTVRPPGCEPRI